MPIPYNALFYLIKIGVHSVADAAFDASKDRRGEVFRCGLAIKIGWRFAQGKRVIFIETTIINIGAAPGRIWRPLSGCSRQIINEMLYW